MVIFFVAMIRGTLRVMKLEAKYGTELIGWLLVDAVKEWEKGKQRYLERERIDDQVAMVLLSKSASIYAGNLELAKKHQAIGVIEGALFLLWQLQSKILSRPDKQAGIVISHNICRQLARHVSKHSEIHIWNTPMIEAYALRSAIYSEIEPKDETEKGYTAQRLKYLIAFIRKSTDMKRVFKTEELGRFSDEYLAKEGFFTPEDAELLSKAVCLWTEEIADEMVKIFEMVGQMPEKEL